MYENGSREPNFETLELIADFFNVDTDYLLGRTSKNTYIPQSSKSNGIKINVLGRVTDGISIEDIEDIIDTEEIPEELARTGTFFGLRIEGDSMEPDIHSGDIVIVKQQADAESDEIVIALTNGNDGVCKRLKKYENSIALISLNPHYEPMYFSSNDINEKPVKIIGKVVELRRKF
jgi:repressor LexA